MNSFSTIKDHLKKEPRRWLVTGVAGFIGSNLLETLLKLDQTVVGLDNFATGHQHNMDQVQPLVSSDQWRRFTFIEGDICDLQTCRKASSGVEVVLHQAALGSVPRSIEDPILTNGSNITGFLNMLSSARGCGVKRFVYAASSSTYGDHPDLPKQEEKIGNPLSPYAVTKYVNELYAGVFARVYGFKTIGLRYFNVFGPRQDPNGAYAAVIPKWFLGMLAGKEVCVYGDGETSRDFCYIDNCVQANLLAACTEDENALDQVYNVACGERTSLNALFRMIRDKVSPHAAGRNIEPVHKDFRPGDVRHSLADIGKAKALLGYHPEYSVKQGLERTADWYIRNLATRPR